MGTAIKSHAEQPERKAPAANRPAGGPFRVLKPGQGIHVRWGTAVGAGALAIAGTEWIWSEIQLISFGPNIDVYFHSLVPVALLLAALYGIYYVVGRMTTVVDFLIATEGEMKKVNWSTRREVWGATKVVIVTVLALGFLLAIVDAFFMLVFGGIGVLKNIKILELFAGGGEG